MNDPHASDPLAVLAHARQASDLIPGDPTRLAAAARELRTAATGAAAVSDQVHGARPTGWGGAAAEEAGQQMTHYATNYAAISDALGEAATALDGHVDALTRAHSQVQEAITRWHAAHQQTQRHYQRYQQRLQQQRQQIFLAEQQGGPIPQQPVPRWTDPMAAEKQAAVAHWQDAERRYAEAVADTRAALQAARSHLPAAAPVLGEQPDTTTSADTPDPAALQQHLATGTTTAAALPGVTSWTGWAAGRPGRDVGDLTEPPGLDLDG